MLGCAGDSNSRTFSEEDDVDNVAPIAGHDHSSGPHDGHLVVFGNEAYHGEIVFNEESGELTVYIIGPDARSPHPISEAQVAVRLELNGEEVELTLPASPESGEEEGMSSRFVLAREDVPEGIQDAEDLHGSIVAVIEGEEYTGTISHDHGDEHAHEHSHEGGDEAHEHAHEDEAHDHSHTDAESSSSQ